MANQKWRDGKQSPFLLVDGASPVRSRAWVGVVGGGGDGKIFMVGGMGDGWGKVECFSCFQMRGTHARRRGLPGSGKECGSGRDGGGGAWGEGVGAVDEGLGGEGRGAGAAEGEEERRGQGRGGGGVRGGGGGGAGASGSVAAEGRGQTSASSSPGMRMSRVKGARRRMAVATSLVRGPAQGAERRTSSRRAGASAAVPGTRRTS